MDKGRGKEYGKEGDGEREKGKDSWTRVGERNMERRAMEREKKERTDRHG